MTDKCDKRLIEDRFIKVLLYKELKIQKPILKHDLSWYLLPVLKQSYDLCKHVTSISYPTQIMYCRFPNSNTLLEKGNKKMGITLRINGISSFIITLFWVADGSLIND